MFFWIYLATKWQMNYQHLLTTLQSYDHGEAINFYIIWQEGEKKKWRERERKRTYAWIKWASDYSISKGLSWKYALGEGGGEGGSDKDTYVSKR